MNTLPWEVVEKEIHFHDVLMNTVITEELHNNKLTEANFPLLLKYQAELAQKRYKGVELTVAPTHKDSGLVARKILLKELARWCDVLRGHFMQRFSVFEQLTWMQKCLDLRKISSSPCELPDCHTYLEKLYIWAVEKGKVELPPFQEVWLQHETLKASARSGRWNYARVC
ncbi:hypothetical protein CYMTET_17367 [Cymbomonas tetramitiformis]|uniref:Uncharacterized protein n=1 Tax=Cymbomonas tetramitiformis TaxID=36881 RepID=A0AAE0GA21_9CHLO|nr:hypothetical protein CYMTET_17367 [Cymbomonas tetramitiformis]